MEIYYNQPKNRSVVMTLGTFDGVHLAHQKLINLAVNRAQELGCDSALFTFTPHPLQIVAPSKAPKALTSWSQKREIIQSLGINQLILKRFTEQFSQIPVQKFVNDYLRNRFSVKEIIVGEDFRCGYQSQGTPTRLKELGNKFGFEVQAIPVVKANKEEIGSTYIRNLVQQGEMIKVKEHLGRNFILDCKVVKGDQRGRKLGFPTANLLPIVDYILPPVGVYACRIRLKDKIYDGVVNLGLRPTFDKREFAIEVHIFDFTEEIYGQRLELEFIDRIRGEERFTTSQELITRINNDIDLAKEILASS